MADSNDPNPARRTELEAALVPLLIEIRGLEDILRTTISGDTKSQISQALAVLTHRRDLIQADLAALDLAQSAQADLVADGYPDLPPFPLLPELFQELQQEKADLDAAFGLFQPGNQETGSFNPQSAKDV